MGEVLERQVRSNELLRSGRNIVRLSLRYIPQILEISRASFERPWRPEDFAFFIEHEGGVNFGYREWVEGHWKLTSYLISFRVWDQWDIVSIATHPHWRGRGQARLLLNRHARCALQRPVYLEVDTKNSAAISLYRSCGFEITGLRKKYYNGTQDALCMKREGC